MSARSAPDLTPPTRSYRCAVACQACRQRKVRCSLAVTGKPCIGCTQDRAECIVIPKQPRKTKRAYLQANRRCDTGSMRGSDAINYPSSDHESNLSVSSAPVGDTREGGVCNEVDVDTPSLEQSQKARATTVRNEDEGDIENEEQNGVEIVTAAFGQSRGNGQVPFYSGSQTGPAYTLDICSPEKPLSTHFLIPSRGRSPLSSADRSYLDAKGVFTLPKTKSCESLLRAYLHHVHPIMPVVEVDHILEYQRNGRLHEYNILLLWSIFSAAVNFVSPEVYQQEGYKSRKEMKASMYSRAKLGAVIAMNYQPQRPKPTVQQFESVESEILKCTLPGQYDSGLTNLARFHSFHVHLHYQALLICLYRPYGSKSPAGLDAAEQEDWQRRMRLKASNAASETNDIFNALAEDGLLIFAGPMTPSLLAAAMQTHMHCYKFADSLTKRLTLHKLEMCMLIMEELQKIYTVASLYRGIFLKALQQICPTYQPMISAADMAANSTLESNSNNINHLTSEAASSQIAAGPFHNTNNSTFPVNASEHETGFLGDFTGSLFDKTSIFSFGDLWNVMLFVIDIAVGILTFFSKNDHTLLAIAALGFINFFWATSFLSVSVLLPPEIATPKLRSHTMAYTVACAQTTAAITTSLCHS
ncbi:hypothetical protein THAR02_00087 [Trichoderma harzianum]|uniref:Zn(2)-C6 fungal-type domain-containing protein n=1 Tax=Trichoderma harzianum TaxID=5544 RepID=A0A0G0ATW6_TRIHA|nr:hypothetical protein THAR02_00087 [Trichoderma harzianum]